jgi:hypothetical protein
MGSDEEEEEEEVDDEDKDETFEVSDSELSSAGTPKKARRVPKRAAKDKVAGRKLFLFNFKIHWKIINFFS